MNLRTQALSGIRWTATSSAILTSTQLLQLVALARILPPQAFGLMAMVTIVVGLAQAYADAGISSAIVYRQDTTSEQKSSLYWLNIFAGVVVFIFLWVLAPTIAQWFNEIELTSLLRVISIIFLIIPFGKQYEILLQKELAFNILARQDIIASIASTVVTITAALIGQAVWSLIWGQISLTLIRTILLLKIGLTIHRPRLRFRITDIREYLGFGLYQMGEKSINFLIQRIDQVLIGAFLGTQVLGYYTLAFNLVAQTYSRINPIINRVAFPIFAKAQDDADRLQRGYLKILRVLIAINAPILVSTAILAPFFVELIFGQQWQPSVILIQILAGVALLRSIGNPVGSLLMSKGRADLSFNWNLSLLLFSFAIVYVGIQLGGAIGVSIAWLLFQIILQWPNYAWLVRPLIGACARAYAWAVIAPFSIAIVMGISVWLGQHLLSPTWPNLSLIITIAILIYSVLLWLLQQTLLAELGDLLLGSHNPLRRDQVSINT